MRLVTTILSLSELNDSDISKAKKSMQEMFDNKIEIQKYKYDDRKYYEVDIDLLDVEFQKGNINEEINKLIKVFEKILDTIPTEFDIICANDDTETEIMKYEKDKNDIQDFGLFVTKREIANLKPYYSSDICNAYLNFEYVSFGCIF